MKSLFTKKNILAAVAAISAAVITVVFTQVNRNVDKIRVEDLDVEPEIRVSDVEDEPVVETKPVRTRNTES